MKKKLIIFIPLLTAVLVFLGVYLYFNHKDAKTNLTVKERNWINSNKKTKYDFEVVNNFPIFASDGNGVILDFIKDFEIDTNLEFNKIAYDKDKQPTTKSLRIRILSNDTNLSENDLIIAEDGYVLISKNKTRYEEIKELHDTKVGIFEGDVGEISYYLKNCQKIEYTQYKTITEILTALDEDKVNYVIIPQLTYLKEILSKDDYYINYYFTEMVKKIVLTLTDDNKELNNIVKKYYEKWKSNEYVSSYNREYLRFYIAAKKINDKTKADMLSKGYVYGYVENLPYEKIINKKMVGIAGEYVSRLQRLTDIDITFKKYDSYKDLVKAIENNEVDMFFNYNNISNNNYTDTISPFVEKYVILRKNKNNSIVTSFEELKGKNINMLKNDAMLKYFNSNSKANITSYTRVDGLTKNNNLIAVDYEIYNYYRNSKFSKYEVIYTGSITNDYKFSISNDNKELYKLFNYIVTTNSYYNYRLAGLSSLNVSLVDDSSFQQLYLIVLGIVLLPILIITFLLIFFKNRQKKIVIKKDDRRKYTDILTSLKNRNYLNLNMQAWEESKVYPQAIVVIDLNNIKYVNDNYGHEAGDSLIIAAASTLVNTQLENSEIIRTDGNEFLVYLVGYTEKQIDTYCKKLNKEFKELPYGFGAALGYSMITDDIKTIDDAINEATLEMKTIKEDLK